MAAGADLHQLVPVQRRLVEAGLADEPPHHRAQLVVEHRLHRAEDGGAFELTDTAEDVGPGQRHRLRQQRPFGHRLMVGVGRVRARAVGMGDHAPAALHELDRHVRRLQAFHAALQRAAGPHVEREHQGCRDHRNARRQDMRHHRHAHDLGGRHDRHRGHRQGRRPARGGQAAGMQRHPVFPRLDDDMRIHVLEFERGEGAGDAAGDRVRAQLRLAARGNRGDPHQVVDVLPLVGLHPDMLRRPPDQAAIAVDVGRHLGHAVDEGVGDEADLVQRVGDRGDLGHRVKIHLAVAGVARIDIAMPAGAGAHHEAAVGARQVDVEARLLAAQAHRFRRRGHRLADQFARHADAVGVRSGPGAGGEEAPLRLGVQDRHAVIGEHILDPGLQPFDLVVAEKAEGGARESRRLLPEGIRRMAGPHGAGALGGDRRGFHARLPAKRVAHGTHRLG